MQITEGSRGIYRPIRVLVNIWTCSHQLLQDSDCTGGRIYQASEEKQDRIWGIWQTRWWSRASASAALAVRSWRLEGVNGTMKTRGAGFDTRFSEFTMGLLLFNMQRSSTGLRNMSDRTVAARGQQLQDARPTALVDTVRSIQANVRQGYSEVDLVKKLADQHRPSSQRNLRFRLAQQCWPDHQRGGTASGCGGWCRDYNHPLWKI